MSAVPHIPGFPVDMAALAASFDTAAAVGAASSIHAVPRTATGQHPQEDPQTGESTESSLFRRLRPISEQSDGGVAVPGMQRSLLRRPRRRIRLISDSTLGDEAETERNADAWPDKRPRVDEQAVASESLEPPTSVEAAPELNIDWSKSSAETALELAKAPAAPEISSVKVECDPFCSLRLIGMRRRKGSQRRESEVELVRPSAAYKQTLSEQTTLVQDVCDPVPTDTKQDEPQGGQTSFNLATSTDTKAPLQQNLAAQSSSAVRSAETGGARPPNLTISRDLGADAREDETVTVQEHEVRAFVNFMHCQLLKEAEHFFDSRLEAEYPPEAKMWPHFQRFACLHTSRSRVEKWVPFHTCLQDHERFLLTEIHTMKEFTAKQQFIAMFIYRAHCREDVFRDAQLNLLRHQSFWEDVQASWAEGGEMEKRLSTYHSQTGKPLQTSAFRIFGKKLRKDKGENLVRNTCERSARLTQVAAEVWDEVLAPFFAHAHGSSTASGKKELYAELAKRLFAVNGLGPTWVKMLMVCIDHRYPELELLQSECVVGAGAVGALNRIVTGAGKSTSEYALSKLTKILNSGCSCQLLKTEMMAMTKLLAKVEELARDKFGTNDIIKKHLHVAETGITAAIVQVQLCEYRQFCEKQDFAGQQGVQVKQR